MRNVLPIPVLCLALVFSSAAVAADIDWSKVDAALGKTATAMFIATVFPEVIFRLRSMV